MYFKNPPQIYAMSLILYFQIPYILCWSPSRSLSSMIPQASVQHVITLLRVIEVCFKKLLT